MKAAAYLVLLCGAFLGCLSGEESTCSSGPDTCETLSDCPPSGVDCVIGDCVAGVCEWVNLATVEVLPVDPTSGLPLGQKCRN